MLILSRGSGESLHIGQEISITILRIKGNQVKIGIDAPKEISVHRAEIYKKIKKGNNVPGSGKKLHPKNNRR